MSKFTQLESDREKNEIQICLTAQPTFLPTAQSHLPFLVVRLSLPSVAPLARFPACIPPLPWLVIAGSSSCQVSNQSPSPGRENQPIRAVSRCLTTRRQPERPSAFFSACRLGISKYAERGTLFHCCWGEGASPEQMIWEAE